MRLIIYLDDILLMASSKEQIGSWHGKLFRKILSSEGISERASNLISSTRKDGTRSNYESAWRKFDSWCSGKQVDPNSCGVPIILDYLAELFDRGYGYNYIASHRSAISAYHELVEVLQWASILEFQLYYHKIQIHLGC